MRVRVNFCNFLVGVSVIRNVPMASEDFLCNHLESAVVFYLGPFFVAYWWREGL